MFGFGKSKEKDSGFKLSRRSKSRLKGVHPDLVRVVKRALRYSAVDFTVLEGVRSADRQRTLVNKGASQTMKSRHLTGHAVDLGAYVDGEVRWDWPLYTQIAEAMQLAAEDEGVPVEWGGCWCKLNRNRSPGDLKEAYIARKHAAGEKAFPDGPHFQLPWATHPKQ